MSAERICCKTEGCEHTILPDTATRTGGYCMRCVGKRKDVERQEYIRQNRREVDRFAGRIDPLDIIRELHTWRRPDPLIIYKPHAHSVVELYARLTPEQRERLMSLASAEKRAGEKNLAGAIVKALATLTDHDLSQLAAQWLDQGEFLPAVMFRGANATVRDRLIRFLVTWSGGGGESLPVNHALCALAWIGDAEVQARFAAWEENPPDWRKHLHVGPNAYAQTGGWELSSGARRELIYGSCFAILPLPKPDAGDGAVVPFLSTSQNCPWCNRPLVAMLAIDTSDSRFEFLEWPSVRLEVLACDHCACFTAHLFGLVDATGVARWHAANRRPSSLPTDATEWGASPWQGVSVRLETRGNLQAVESDVGVKASQIGGHPCWVQDTAYPLCPDCHQTMKFIAQLDNGDFKHAEGTYYAFLCQRCRVTATCYQQT